MRYRLQLINGLMYTALLAAVFVQSPALARSAAATTDRSDTHRYIVILADMPLATYDGRVMATPEMDNSKTQLSPTAISFTGQKKLDVRTPASMQYLHFLDERFKAFKGEALLRLGRQIKPVHTYRNVLNGLAVDLTASEARALLELPMVTAVEQEKMQHVRTDSGPTWIGADKIHNGTAGHPKTGGEGIIIGMIDTGINWDHPSFADPGQTGTGWDHVNPHGSQLGLCSDPEVLCNDKLIGVYDFIEDISSTDVIEENTKGKDNDGHGSHTSSTAAGNPLSFSYNGVPTNIAGVAPNANIISYRVCFEGDPEDPDDDGCSPTAAIKALDQAIADDVDIINYSIGGDFYNPWIQSQSTFAFLNARAAGIFVATSAGNSGPNGGTVGSPANAPWITSVGNATHDRVYGAVLENLSGGNTALPDNLIGASFTGGIGVRTIVHAKDFGNAFCGTGPAELMPDCDGNTGASNPFSAGTFNGEIVVCDRGTYGRVEKGKNVMLAGAGGYVLANTEAQGDSVVADSHCLPATHLGVSAGNELRTWLDSGSNHQGSLSGFSVFHIPEAGDIIASSSSRGPNQSPVGNVMKPDVIAPGTSILAAWTPGSTAIAEINGTSMASPHVAGGAALLKSVHPDWSPAAIASALTMTATPDSATDFDGSAVTMHKQGGGRVRLDQAVNAALYLNETETGFRAANPGFGGDPKDLNLPGLIDTECVTTCSFQRTVTDLAGGASWTASVEGLPEGVSVTVSPTNFSLANGASRQLNIDVDLSGTAQLHSWIYGKVRLQSNGHPDAIFPLGVFYSSGVLPSSWSIETDEQSGWKEFALNDLVDFPDATYTTGGLVTPTITVGNLPQDPTDDSPYDNDVGVMTVWHTITADTLWFHTETLASSAEDLDLFVGRDTNGDGIAQESEELCTSTTPIDIELCDLFLPVPGEYWIRVQNWDSTLDPDEVTLVSAVVNKDTSSLLTATGNGIIAAGDNFNVRLSWDNVNAVPGSTLYGAFGLGTRRENSNNAGVVPVSFTKTAVADAKTLVLMNDVSRGLTLAANAEHKRMFVDIPPGVDSLVVSASGADSTQSENLDIELYRVDFDELFADAPFAAAVDTSGSPVVSASGSNGNGPSVTVDGGSLVPGRWYVVLKNTRGQSAAVNIVANMIFSGERVPLRNGLWESSTRGNIASGYDYSSTGGFRALVWYTYDEAGDPAWYIGSAQEPEGNVWTANLLHVTNDGALQQSKPVGQISVTMLQEGDAIYSFTLFGEDGSDRIYPSLQPSCPTIDGVKKSFDGHWARDNPGVGGATVIVNSGSQAFIHYIYDGEGAPVWLIGSPSPQSASAEESQLKQLGGFCPTCAEVPITTATVGVFSREFESEERQTWMLDYVLESPLVGSVERTDEAGKLTVKLSCP